MIQTSTNLRGNRPKPISTKPPEDNAPTSTRQRSRKGRARSTEAEPQDRPSGTSQTAATVEFHNSEAAVDPTEGGGTGSDRSDGESENTVLVARG